MINVVFKNYFLVSKTDCLFFCYLEFVDSTRYRKRSSTLDEITNKVFEDLLKGKSQTGFDDLGVLDFDARSSKVSVFFKV